MTNEGDSPVAPPPSDADVRRRFERLKQQWLDDTADMGAIDFTHEAHQQIIGLGPPAIPILLDEMQRETGYWFRALNAITGEDPTQPGDDYDFAVAAWLRWAVSEVTLMR